VGVGAAGVVGGDQQLVVRDESRRAVDVFALGDEQARALEQLDQPRIDELVEPCTTDGDAEQEEPQQQRQRVGVAQSAQIARQLGRSREQLVPGREPLLDRGRLVAGRVQQTRELAGLGGAARERGLGAPRRRDRSDWLQRRYSDLLLLMSNPNFAPGSSDPSLPCSL
jgi:hypothetical protein